MIPLEQVEALPFHIRATIPTEYLDMFGHMNMQYYVELFSKGGFVTFASYGMDEAYFQESNCAIFAVEQHIKYFREVYADDTVAVYTRLFARAEKRFHFMMFLVNETQQTLSATMEVLAFHVDRGIRKSAPFPEAVAARLDKHIAEHNALDWDAPHSKPLGI